MKRFSIVVAHDGAWGIAKDGDLPWHIPGDLAHFKATTTATPDKSVRNAVIMGRKTWESIPARFRPLRRRLNIVVTRNPDYDAGEGVLVATSMDEALTQADRADVHNVFLVGGATLYNEAIGRPDCEALIVTRVRGTFACDVALAPFDATWLPGPASNLIEENGIEYDILTYRRQV